MREGIKGENSPWPMCMGYIFTILHLVIHLNYTTFNDVFKVCWHGFNFFKCLVKATTQIRPSW